MTDWGPGNPHPLSRMGTELVWENKYDEHGRRAPIRLPDWPLSPLLIEAVDAPRDHYTGGACPDRPPGESWRNLLLWGDNKLALAALLDRFRGRVDLVYIDPPFHAGADVSVQLPLGDASATIEAIAYRDTWGRSAGSYLQMLAERLALIKELLSERGNLFVHVDYRANSLVRLLLDEILGPNLVNEVIWHYNSGPRAQNAFGKRHDTLYRYGRDAGAAFLAADVEAAREPYSPDINIPAGKAHYYHPLGKVKGDVWRINILGQNDKRERTGFDTQKPEALLAQIIAVCCPEDGLVADFFCGSGTTLAVAEKLGRRWIGVDAGRYAIHTTRKRLIHVQRELYAAGRPFRPFDIHDLGRDERRWWMGDRLDGRNGAMRQAVLRAYHARPWPDVPALQDEWLHGLKGEAAVHVGAPESSLSAAQVRAAAGAARAAGRQRLDCLAWEMDVGLAAAVEPIEAESGASVRLLIVPRDIVESNHAPGPFFEAGFLEARAVRTGNAADVELLRVVPGLPVEPPGDDAALRIRAARAPLDFIDFWAVDFTYEAGRPFHHHWQSFRTRRDRRLVTRTDIGWVYPEAGLHQIAVWAVDVFGHKIDTVIDLNILSEV